MDDLEGPEIASFLDEHIEDMRSVSPPESKHALDLNGLRVPEITFWTVWDAGKLVACGALKELDSKRGEIKSMRTRPARKRGGIASSLLGHVIAVAHQRGYHELYLETGSMEFFEPARRLYRKFGFDFCDPFGGYRPDPNSVHMRLDLLAR